MPAHDAADEQVLRFAHQGADPAQGGAHGAVHHQVAEEAAELFQVGLFLFLQGQVAGQVVDAGAAVLAGHVAVVDVVEAVGHGDDHRGDGEGVEKGGEKGSGGTEQQRDFDL